MPSPGDPNPQLRPSASARSSSNRDEDLFDNPFTFNILRNPNPHMAFGGGGPHFYGSAVRTGETRDGDTVVVMGVGGIGMNAVQGARIAGARAIVALDPVEYKRSRSMEQFRSGLLGIFGGRLVSGGAYRLAAG